MSDASDQRRRRLVVLHGHGDEPGSIRDWAGEIAAGATLCLPPGPVQVPEGGLAWFSDGDGGELESLVRELDAALVSTPGEARTDVLVGWSQGGAAALAYAMRPTAPPLAGVVAMAGWLPALEGMEWEARPGAAVLMVHGADDEVVPVTAAKSAARAMERWGADVTWVEVAGGHVVSREMVEIVSGWVLSR